MAYLSLTPAYPPHIYLSEPFLNDFNVFGELTLAVRKGDERRIADCFAHIFRSNVDENGEVAIKLATILLSFCRADNGPLLTRFVNTFPTGKLSVIISTASYRIDDYTHDGREMFAQMLHGAHCANDKKLLEACLEALFCRVNDLFLGKPQSRNFYAEISVFHSHVDLVYWAGCSFVEAFHSPLKPAHDPARALEMLTFLRYYAPAPSEEMFLQLLDRLVYNFTVQQKTELVKFLLELSTQKLCDISLSRSLFSLIERWNLSGEKDLRQFLIVLLTDAAQKMVTRSYSEWKDVWLEAVYRFSRSSLESPLITLLREHLGTLADGRRSIVFSLLDVGMNVFKDVAFVDACLQSIDHHALHAEIPAQMDCLVLLRENPDLPKYTNEVLYRASNIQTTFSLPRVLIHARAPQLDYINTIPCNLGELRRLLLGIASPQSLDQFIWKDLAEVAQLYSLAEKVGAVAAQKKLAQILSQFRIQSPEDFNAVFFVYQREAGPSQTLLRRKLNIRENFEYASSEAKHHFASKQTL